MSAAFHHDTRVMVVSLYHGAASTCPRRPDPYAMKAGAYRRGPKTSAVALCCGIPLNELGYGDGVESRNCRARLFHIDEVDLLQLPTIPVWVGTGVDTPLPGSVVVAVVVAVVVGDVGEVVVDGTAVVVL